MTHIHNETDDKIINAVFQAHLKAHTDNICGFLCNILKRFQIRRASMQQKHINQVIAEHRD